MPYQPGQSGNPRGRPSGMTQAGKLRRAIAKRIPEILESLCNLAVQGDTAAAKLLLDRALPALRPVDLPAGVSLPPDLEGASAAILAALAAGALTPDQSSSLAAVLAALAKVRESVDLEARITALEMKNANP